MPTDQTSTLQLIDDRDRAQDVADKLADAVGRLLGVDVGEHSSMNDPWQNALSALEQALPLRARLDAAHDALTRITEADDDAFTTLESTVEYVVRQYRAVAASEERAADEIQRLRVEVQRMERVYLAALNWRLARDEADGDGTRDVQDRYDAAVHRLVEACERLTGEAVSGRG